jgi:hypothetical protein
MLLVTVVQHLRAYVWQEVYHRFHEATSLAPFFPICKDPGSVFGRPSSIGRRRVSTSYGRAELEQRII